MLKQRWGLLAHLKKLIIKVHNAYIPSARCPIEYIDCPLQHEESCTPHVRLKDINKFKSVYCFKSGKIVPPQAYMMLLTTDTGKKYIYQKCLVLLCS